MAKSDPHEPNSKTSLPTTPKRSRPRSCSPATRTPRNLPSEILARLAARLPEFRFNRYPDPTAHELRRLIAEANGLEPENVLIGNGGDELIFDMLLAWGGPGRKLLDMPPTFTMYGIDATVTGTEIGRASRGCETSRSTTKAVMDRVAKGDIDVVVVANPNNPTGGLTDESFLIDLLHSTDALVMVDEAYFEFSRHTMRPHMSRCDNLVILRTFSKAFSMAGLRVGYLLAHPDVVTEFMKVRQPYSVDSFSQWVAGPGLSRADGLRAGHQRHHPRPRPARARSVDDFPEVDRLSERGELRALPSGARRRALARPAAQPLGARARLLARARVSRTACASR